jgi:hypothetical protein
MKTDIPIFILLLTWVVCLGGCERDRNGDPIILILKNNSNDTLDFVTQFNYPDTSLMNSQTSSARACIVYPNSENKLSEFKGWENTIKKENPNETLIIVVYSLDTLQKYSFSQIQMDYNILKRYDLSIEQLKAMNWTVIYP